MNIRLTPFLALIVNLFIVNNIIGQIKMTPNYKFDIYNHDKSILSQRGNLLYGTDKKFKQWPDYNNLIISLDTFRKAELIASNNNFDIYKLSMDNMPCLVPNKYFHGNMNTMRKIFNYRMDFYLNDKIPNPFKKQDLIPLNN